MKSCHILMASLLALGISGLLGCKKAKDQSVIELRWVTDNNPARADQIARFEKANPGVKINLDWSSKDMKKLIVQIAGDTPPDLFDIGSADVLAVFAKKGALLDLTDLLKRDNLNLDEILWTQAKSCIAYKGRTYGMPCNTGTIVLFYNKKIFDECKVAYPDGTWTWDKFVEAAKKLTNAHVEKDLAKKHYGTGVEFLQNFVPWQYGADFFSPDGKKCVADSPNYKKAMRFITDLRFTHQVSPTMDEIQNVGSSVSGWGVGGDQNLFAGGKMAMFFRGRWAVIAFRQDKNLKYGIAPIPYPKGGKRIGFYNNRVVVASSRTKYPDEVLKFMKFLLTEDYNQTISHGGDGMPAVISLAKSSSFLKDPEFPEENQNQIYLDSVKYSRPMTFSDSFDPLEVKKIRDEEFEKMWAGLDTPEKTLDRIAERINQLPRLEN